MSFLAGREELRDSTVTSRSLDLSCRSRGENCDLAHTFTNVKSRKVTVSCLSNLVFESPAHDTRFSKLREPVLIYRVSRAIVFINSEYNFDYRPMAREWHNACWDIQR